MLSAMGFASLIINTSDHGRGGYSLLNPEIAFHPYPKIEIKHRLRIIYGASCAHIMELWLFGVAVFLMLKHDPSQG